MSDAISEREFHEAAGVDDWRVILGKACAYFRTGSFATGLRLVDAIGALAETANHHPDVDLRYSGLTVRLVSHDIGGLSRRDVVLAQQISVAAAELGVTSDPTAVETVEIAIDVVNTAAVLPFWRAVLDYQQVGDRELADPYGHGPAVWFQDMDPARLERNRIHLDVSVPHDLVEARLAAALAAGGRLVSEAAAPKWWVLADAEGNEACITSWLGRD